MGCYILRELDTRNICFMKRSNAKNLDYEANDSNSWEDFEELKVNCKIKDMWDKNTYIIKLPNKIWGVVLLSILRFEEIYSPGKILIWEGGGSRISRINFEWDAFLTSIVRIIIYSFSHLCFLLDAGNYLKM